MIYGVSYSDDKMTKSKELCSLSMLKNGVDEVEDNITLDWNFSKFNADILSSPRGCGYWLWKPYCINEIMNRCNDGDMVVYADSGVEFIAPVREIISRMDQNAFLFTNTHPNHHWTKRYALDQMQPGWEKEYDKDTPWPQVQASVIFLKVCEETRRFVKEWLLWAQMPDIISDKPSPQGEYPFYQDHRHDQSIITVLAYRYGYRLHWWPTAYAEHIRVPGDTYPVLFNHHRKRNHEWHNG